MPRLSKQSSEAHWSKDFIEHLRSVHFFLIAVAVTGIVFGLTPTKAERQTAQHQLRTILAFISRQQKDIDDALKQASEPRDGQFLAFDEMHYFTDIPESIVLVPTCYVRRARPERGRDYARYADVAESFNTWRDDFANMVYLDDFILKWDSTHCGAEGQGGVFFISRILGGALMTGRSTDIPLRKFDGNSSTLLAQHYKYARISASLPQPDPRKDASEIHEPEIPIERAEEGDGLYWLDLDGTSINIFARGHFHPELLDAVAFGGPYFDWGLSEISTVMKGPRFDCERDFKSCFPELYRLTQNKASWSLKDLSELVDSEVANAESHLELGGIKFPNENISAAGIILTITVLAYFYLHLRELSPRIRPTDSGLEVAWLGLYSSWLAYALVWLSILLVPLCSVALLGVKVSPYGGLSEIHDHWKSFFAWILLPCLVTVTLGVLSSLSARRLARLAADTFEADDAMPIPEVDASFDQWY